MRTVSETNWKEWMNDTAVAQHAWLGAKVRSNEEYIIFPKEWFST